MQNKDPTILLFKYGISLIGVFHFVMSLLKNTVLNFLT
jgi:hypothetical protein